METVMMEVEEVRVYLEKVMLTLDPNKSKREHGSYMAGVIDTLCDAKMVSENDRETIYVEYCG